MGMVVLAGFVVMLLVATGLRERVMNAVPYSLRKAISIGIGLFIMLIGLVTITLSTYMIVHSQRLYELIEPLLGPFERRHPFREDAAEDFSADRDFDVILFGLGRYGGRPVSRAVVDYYHQVDMGQLAGRSDSGGDALLLVQCRDDDSHSGNGRLIHAPHSSAPGSCLRALEGVRASNSVGE
jgi:hypothetical protein